MVIGHTAASVVTDIGCFFQRHTAGFISDGLLNFCIYIIVRGLFMLHLLAARYGFPFSIR